ncbi:MAG: hypothetical protein ACM3ST_04960 [Bdellovibrio bacteriovorus]
MSAVDGVDPYAYLQSAAGRLDRMEKADLDRLLDDLEYLYEVMDPELQPLADGVMERARARLAALGRP